MKKIILIILAILVLAIAGYIYWRISKSNVAAPVRAIDEAQNATTQTVSDSVAKATLPTLKPTVNPTENLPDTNPINKTNPFKVNYNPFGP